MISGGSGGAREVPRVPGAGGHRRPPPQRRVLPRPLPRTTATSRCGGRSTRTTCSSRASGCSSRCRAARTRSRSGTSSCALGYEADGLYLGLGIGDYSDESGAYARAFADAARPHAHRGRPRAPTTATTSRGAAAATRRAPCGACGLSKRHLFNSAALEHGYDVVATGHNLDDEAAVLLGNVLRWETGYLGRQYPVLPAAPGFVAQGEAARAARRARDGGLLRAARHRLPGRGVPDGRRQPPPRVQGGAQRARGPLARHEGRVPVRLPRARPRALRRRRRRASATSSGACTVCGAPTPGEVCAFCRLREQATRVELTRVGASSRDGRVPSPPATACCSSTPSGAATSSRSPTAASSTPTPGVLAHDDLIGQPEGVDRAHHARARGSSRCARRSPSTCSRCRAARR